MIRALSLAVLLSLLILAGWAVAGRKQDAGPDAPGGRFSSLSFAPFRAGQSPLRDRFPTEAEAEADMALIAPVTRAVRSYAAIEGPYDAAALAQRHGLTLWQGIWLGADRARNQLEIARGIALARAYPDTITRVVVGNEVLLRRDLPPAELIAAIDQVRAAVKQPVAYADVWEFWEEFPEIARHVDIILVHLLPYWEDVPTGIDAAIAHVDAVFSRMQALFPGKRIGIGETGWPSEGRARRDAVPSRVNETRFLRAFMALSARRGFDYNFIEAFDQEWKYASEGRVGAAWGIFDSARQLKIPPQGDVSNLPQWPGYAALSVAAGLALAAWGGFGVAAVLLGMGLGLGLGVAAADTLPFLFNGHVRLAAAANLGGQALLAALAMRAAGPPALHGVASLRALQNPAGLALRRGQQLSDLFFVFLCAAAIDQALLACDSRYRDFPFGAFAVPLVLAAWRLARGAGGLTPDPAERLVGAALLVFALISQAVEGRLNHQAMLWNACALVLAASCLLRPASARARGH